VAKSHLSLVAPRKGRGGTGTWKAQWRLARWNTFRKCRRNCDAQRSHFSFFEFCNLARPKENALSCSNIKRISAFGARQKVRYVSSMGSQTDQSLGGMAGTVKSR
jgi:hypothetical protein